MFSKMITLSIFLNYLFVVNLWLLFIWFLLLDFHSRKKNTNKRKPEPSQSPHLRFLHLFFKKNFAFLKLVKMTTTTRQSTNAGPTHIIRALRCRDGKRGRQKSLINLLFNCCPSHESLCYSSSRKFHVHKIY